MQERYFYHSFPRRGNGKKEEFSKGLGVLKSIRDFGLLITPEVTPYSYNHANGTPPRVEEILQRRISFTELSPDELSVHSTHFGHFALEYEINIVKLMGAIPVFYIPLDMRDGARETLPASVLVIHVFDAINLLIRLCVLDNLKNYENLPERLPFNIDFSQNPSLAKTFDLNTNESLKVLEMVNHGVTPVQQLI